jgi:2-polyprenyl-3-methyl-5-hydroxy-6-metoxy-1,4-benzoquinol methylase
METQASEWRDQDKIRQQFDYGPYPRISLEQSAKDDVDKLFHHNLVTAYYLHHRRVVDTSNKVILDAGCGTGYKSLVLAEANPGAKIVGIDLSEQSLQLARQRLQHHGFDNVEFISSKLKRSPSSAWNLTISIVMKCSIFCLILPLVYEP